MRAFRLPLGMTFRGPVTVLRFGPLYIVWRHGVAG